MQQQEIVSQWRHAGITLLAVAVVITIAFYNTVNTLVLTWWDKPEYNHCLLILPIIIYLINERREIFTKIAPEPSWLGLFPLLGGGLLWLLGDLADANVVRQFGFIILIQGSVLTILGKRVVLALLFPLFYMVFLIPFGDFLVPLLQDYTTWFLLVTLDLFNIPVYVEGYYISIAAGNFHVAEACAGLRFLVATIALGTLMANVAYKTTGRQVIVVLLSFIVPIVANGFRASGIILIAHWSDMKYATGADHLTFGWIFFAIVLLIFISIAMTFTNRGLKDGYIDFSKKYWTLHKPKTIKYFISYLIAATFVIGFFPIYTSFIEQRYEGFENNSISLNDGIWGQNVADITNWKPYYRGASQIFHQRQEDVVSDPVDIFIAYYKYQTKDVEIIRNGNGVVPVGEWGLSKRRIIDNVDGSSLSTPVIEDLLFSNVKQRLVWHWYWIDGKIVTNNYQAKLLGAKAKLFAGRLDSAVIAVSVEVNSTNIDQKRLQLSKFVAMLPPMESIVSKQ